MSCFWIVLSSALLLSPKADFIAGSVKKPLALKAQIIGNTTQFPPCGLSTLSALLAWHLPHLARRIGT